jgi:hypothetical protein
VHNNRWRSKQTRKRSSARSQTIIKLGDNIYTAAKPIFLSHKLALALLTLRAKPSYSCNLHGWLPTPAFRTFPARRIYPCFEKASIAQNRQSSGWITSMRITGHGLRNETYTRVLCDYQPRVRQELRRPSRCPNGDFIPAWVTRRIIHARRRQPQQTITAAQALPCGCRRSRFQGPRNPYNLSHCIENGKLHKAKKKASPSLV